MLVFAAEENERIKYILDQILVLQLGISYKITDNLDYFIKSKSIRLNYSPNIIEGAINIPSNNLLYETKIIPQRINVIDDPIWFKIFFKLAFEKVPDFQVETSYLSFDLLSASFYLLSRYEEYSSELSDEHNRFKATGSVAYKNNFLKIPLIDLWVEEFKKKILSVYPSLTFKTHHFTKINTIDIDFAYKYKGRSKLEIAKKYIGSLLRFKPNKNLFKSSENDPYDTYDYLLRMAGASNIETKFFFLLASNGKHDKNINPASQAAVELYNRLSESHKCGIHPSYKASFDYNLLKSEVEIFEKITANSPKISRYHFLKLKLPESFGNLEKLDIEADYTLCYADQIGFRASTCRPFEAYDLINNTKFGLLLYSPCLMDVTLKNYLSYNPETAKLCIREMLAITQKYQGKFISIWHNSSFDIEEGWLGWDKVYESLFE
jgi:hypothetical protein